MINLENVDNTSDINKPISNATQIELNKKANIDSPTFTGTVQVPYPGDNSDNLQVATTNFVNNKLKNYISNVKTSGSLDINDRGTLIYATNDIIIPNLTFNKLDYIMIYNNSDNSISIIPDINLTLRLANTTLSGSINISSRGFINILFISQTEAVGIYIDTNNLSTLNNPYFTGTVSLPDQIWNGNITWNTSNNIIINGNSYFNIIDSGNFGLYDYNIDKTIFSYTNNNFQFNINPTAPTLQRNTCNTQLATTEFVDYLRSFSVSSITAGYLTLNDRNSLVLATSDIIVPSGIFSLNNSYDKINIFNNSQSVINIQSDEYLTLILSGYSSSYNYLLPINGFITLIFVNTNKAIIVSPEIFMNQLLSTTLSISNINLNGLDLYNTIINNSNNSNLQGMISINGGGTVSWNIGIPGSIYWSSNLNITYVGKTNTSISISCPTSGNIIRYLNNGSYTYTCSASGIPLSTRDMLYYNILTSTFIIYNTGNTSQYISDNHILIAIKTNDTLKWIPNNISIPTITSNTYTNSTGICSWLLPNQTFNSGLTLSSGDLNILSGNITIGNTGASMNITNGTLNITGAINITNNDLNIINNNYGRIKYNNDINNSIIFRGNPTNISGNITNTDCISFTQNNGDYRFYLQSSTNLNLLLQISTEGIFFNGNEKKNNLDNRIYMTQAYFSLSGGGTVSWNTNNNLLSWDGTITAYPIDKYTTSSGYISIKTPISGALFTRYTNYATIQQVTYTNGFSMTAYKGWCALFYVWIPGNNGADNNSSYFVIIDYFYHGSKVINENWILIAIRNGDNNTIKWIPQQKIIPAGNTNTYRTNTDECTWQKQFTNIYSNTTNLTINRSYCNNLLVITNPIIVTIPTNNAFIAYDSLKILNNSSGNITIVRGSYASKRLSLYIAGTSPSTSSDKILVSNGICEIYFLTGYEAIITSNSNSVI